VRVGPVLYEIVFDPPEDLGIQTRLDEVIIHAGISGHQLLSMPVLADKNNSKI
jgi:hypothetical protein